MKVSLGTKFSRAFLVELVPRIRFVPISQSGPNSWDVKTRFSRGSIAERNAPHEPILKASRNGLCCFTSFGDSFSRFAAVASGPMLTGIANWERQST